MARVVVKFGGTSLESVEKIKKAGQKVCDLKRKGYDVVVVLSAMGKTTDELINLSKKLSGESLDLALQDKLLNLGELQSVYLFCLFLKAEGCECIGLNGNEAGIFTSGEHGNASIQKINIADIIAYLDDGNIVVVAGFCGENEQHEITTLGRGGSDTTAVALASALRCACHIYTDVSNVYTIDPKIFKKARKIKEISFDDMLELSAFGAKVLETRCVEIAKKSNTEISLSENAGNGCGTKICKDPVEALEIVGVGTKTGFGLAKFVFKKDEMLTISNTLKEFNAKILNINNLELCVEMVCLCGKEKLQILANLMKNMCQKTTFCHNITMVSLVGRGFCTQEKELANLLCKLTTFGIEIKYLNYSASVLNIFIKNVQVQKAIEYISEIYEFLKQIED